MSQQPSPSCSLSIPRRSPSNGCIRVRNPTPPPPDPCPATFHGRTGLRFLLPSDPPLCASHASTQPPEHQYSNFPAPKCRSLFRRRRTSPSSGRFHHPQLYDPRQRMKILEPIQEHPINLQTPPYPSEVLLDPALNGQQHVKDQPVIQEKKMKREAALHAPFMESHNQKRPGEAGSRLCGYAEHDEVDDVVMAPEEEEIKSPLLEREENMALDTMQCGGGFIIVDKMKVREEKRANAERLRMQTPSPQFDDLINDINRNFWLERPFGYWRHA